eukprot:TRINITY_DN3429_c0_g6_i1.p1 TRINITY_DN3429_c0_g6~~TRINITY_DN3429_c0_g6_i1.p1  ORF type:complete len:191 (+),score=20.40 TRINITY_DN3429_c0_g6_i1:15-587(+)
MIANAIALFRKKYRTGENILLQISTPGFVQICTMLIIYPVSLLFENAWISLIIIILLCVVGISVQNSIESEVNLMNVSSQGTIPKYLIHKLWLDLLIGWSLFAGILDGVLVMKYDMGLASEYNNCLSALSFIFVLGVVIAFQYPKTMITAPVVFGLGSVAMNSVESLTRNTAGIYASIIGIIALTLFTKK